jgi:hypothetical protein
MSMPSGALLTGWWLTPSPRINRPPVASAAMMAGLAQIGDAQINVGDPRADFDMAGRHAHQLRCRHRVIADLGAQNCFEASVLSGKYLRRPPTHARDDANCQAFRHRFLPFWF